MKPLEPERGNHLVMALVLVVVTVAAFGVNILSALGWL